MSLRIYNSLTKQVESFKSLKPKKVTIYVCGITPYDTTHLGHAFTYIFFDTLVRFLKFQGFKVIYTQNVTDINDRDQDLLKRAKEENIPWNKLANYWTKRFLKDMTALNWIMPTHYLKASENIPGMLALIKKLLNNNLAYKINGSVYLDIYKDSDFGKLSRLSWAKMLKVAKEFEEDLKNPDKRNPLDITLWRQSPPNQSPHIPFFDSPFGKGRPGWHIECSAMSMSSLGPQIDIHGGGQDLIFPHHEAEIAQSEGVTGKIPFVKYWIHTGNVFYKGAKMSKSKGNLVLVSDLLKKYSPNAIRYLLLSHHFRQSWEYKEEEIKKAQNNINALETVTNHSKQFNPEAIKQFIKIMDHDLNTKKALELILKLSKTTNVNQFLEILGFNVSSDHH